MTIDPNAISPTPETSGGENATEICDVCGCFRYEHIGQQLECPMLTYFRAPYHDDSGVDDDKLVDEVVFGSRQSDIMEYAQEKLRNRLRSLRSRLSPPSSSGEEADPASGKPDKMLYVGGEKQSYQCDCGCNVFREIRPNVYRCNSCDSDFIADAPNTSRHPHSGETPK